MGDLSEHFSRHEFACKCGCGFDTVDYELIIVKEDLRDHFGCPVYTNSGCRCKKHNKAVGGAQDSQHLIGRASDAYTNEFHPSALYRYLDEKYPNQYGLGLYETFVHIDTRKHRARWIDL